MEIVDRARRKKGWNKQANIWAEKHNLKRFWSAIPIDRDTFIEICKAVGIENWEDIIDNSPLSQTDLKAEFFAFDGAWVGRKDLINQLTDKVKGSCRLLILLGNKV
ncbi:MAG: hypothetical protein HC942_07025 [Microcoleus sp. SU_5_6]|nr:hypothetical protein [Microcoleus sp. SU_5_6]NJL66525.1 hypothetical protein [Microcoleus sp. SM1_3_4]